ncbi:MULTISPECIES: hypothetical protein [unclassified Streptomyces]|uniref:hypothetical protein n=1 Tax=unclassified Streptomyces TaxID=2593676 RepID=UPI001BAF6D96|nr:MULTISPECIES: hypothetical protein [unclassified Streptomyces]WKX23614.1 hypothetical protein Q3Y68_16105 [Streptomyces sp. HUAS CX7]
MSLENGVGYENYGDELSRGNAHFSEKPQVSSPPSHSLHEWQEFSHRLHEAGHQPYCLVWP